MQIDWPGIRAAAVAIGVREAARRAGANLTPEDQERFVERVMKRSSREGWLVAIEPVKLTPHADNRDSEIVRNVRNGSDTVKDALAHDAEQTRVDLAKAARAAAGEFRSMDGQEVIATSEHFRRIVSSAAQIHNWGERGQDQGGDMLILSIGGNVNLGQQIVQKSD